MERLRCFRGLAVFYYTEKETSNKFVVGDKVELERLQKLNVEKRS